MITYGAAIVILLAPLHELGATAEGTRGVFGNSLLMCNGEGCNGGFKRWPVGEVVVWIVPFIRPVVGDGWMHRKVVYLLLMELGLFVGAQVE